MGEIIPLPLRARAANAASRFEMIGGHVHQAQMLTFPPIQVREIHDIWGMTVEGPPRVVPVNVAFSDGQPGKVKGTRAKSSTTKTSAAKTISAKRKNAQRAPK